MYDYSRDITDYIYKQMSEIQREAFELKLESDPELAAEVLRQEDMLEAMRAERMYREALKDPQVAEDERLAMERMRKKSKKTSKSKGHTKLFLIARILTSTAAIALLLIMTLNMRHMLLRTRRKAHIRLIKRSWKQLWYS